MDWPTKIKKKLLENKPLFLTFLDIVGKSKAISFFGKEYYAIATTAGMNTYCVDMINEMNVYKMLYRNKVVRFLFKVLPKPIVCGLIETNLIVGISKKEFEKRLLIGLFLQLYQYVENMFYVEGIIEKMLEHRRKSYIRLPQIVNTNTSKSLADKLLYPSKNKTGQTTKRKVS